MSNTPSIDDIERRALDAVAAGNPNAAYDELEQIAEQWSGRLEHLSMRSTLNGSLLASEQREFDALTASAERLTKLRKLVTERCREQHLAERAAHNERRAAANAAVPLTLPDTYTNVSVRSEAGVYRPDGGPSFFGDLRARALGDPDASDRLNRHQRGALTEFRDITTSTLNGLIPPRYLLDQAAALARASAPFWDLLPSDPLPETGMTLYVTKTTTGTATAVQTSQNTAVQETNMVTTDLSVPVVTIAGQQDVSRQIVERGGAADRFIFNDLAADWYTRRGWQAINGTGSNGQMTGILNASSVNTASFSGTTISAFYTAVGGALNAVASNRYAPATIILMHPRRWFWMCEQADTTGRPMVASTGVAANPIAVFQQNAAAGIVGTIYGVPVVIDANVTTTASASTNEDRVICSRIEDHVAWTDPRSPFTITLESLPSGPESMRLAVWGYAAATFERQPKATTIISGTGLALTP